MYLQCKAIMVIFRHGTMCFQKMKNCQEGRELETGVGVLFELKRHKQFPDPNLIELFMTNQMTPMVL